MILLLIRMLLRALLLPQFFLVVLISSILDLGAATAARMLELFDRVLIQPARDSLLWFGDWIDWCLEPALIVFHTWKEIVSVLFSALRPVKFGLLLWAACVDLFVQPFLCIIYLFVSLVRSTCKAFFSTFKELLPSEVGKILPVQTSVAAARLRYSEEVSSGIRRKRGNFGTNAGPMTRKLAKLGLTVAEPSNQHRRVEDYTTSIISALFHALFDYLSEEEGATALGKFMEHYALAAQIAMSEVSQSPTSTIGNVMAAGAYDAAGAKFAELTSKLPTAVKTVFFPVLACYTVLFCSGLLFSLLRFAVYGLH